MRVPVSPERLWQVTEGRPGNLGVTVGSWGACYVSLWEWVALWPLLPLGPWTPPGQESFRPGCQWDVTRPTSA